MNFHVVFSESGLHFQTDSFKELLAETALELNRREDQLIIDPDELNPNDFDNIRLYGDEDPVARIYTDEQYQRSRS